MLSHLLITGSVMIAWVFITIRLKLSPEIFLGGLGAYLGIWAMFESILALMIK